MIAAAKKALPMHSPPVCPPEVPQDIRAEFDRLAKLLGERLRPEDSDLLLLYAAAWATWRSAQADVARDGRVVMSGGTAIPHPALTVAGQAHQQILALSRELGIGPSQRKRLKLDKRPRPQEDWLG